VKSRPAASLGVDDAKAFLTDLAVRQDVAASTRNQAFNALLFFFRHVLGREFGEIDGVVRAKRRRYIPVVLSRPEVETLLGTLEPPYRLVGGLLYGCGLRLSECLGLSINCIDLDGMILTIHDGKGQRDRTVPLPERLRPNCGDDLTIAVASVYDRRSLREPIDTGVRKVSDSHRLPLQFSDPSAFL
jgi:integrase